MHVNQAPGLLSGLKNNTELGAATGQKTHTTSELEKLPPHNETFLKFLLTKILPFVTVVRQYILKLMG
jgi:hypothetical protein